MFLPEVDQTILKMNSFEKIACMFLIIGLEVPQLLSATQLDWLTNLATRASEMAGVSCNKTSEVFIADDDPGLLIGHAFEHLLAYFDPSLAFGTTERLEGQDYRIILSGPTVEGTTEETVQGLITQINSQTLFL